MPFNTVRGSFRVEGLSDLVKSLTKLPDAVRDKAVNDGTLEGAKVIQRAAITNAPKKTGKLSRNIVVRKNRKTRYDSEHSVVIRKIGKAVNSKNAYYGIFVEYGTSKMPAQPFMRPAFEGNKEIAVSVLAGHIRETVGRYRVKARRLR